MKQILIKSIIYREWRSVVRAIFVISTLIEINQKNYVMHEMRGVLPAHSISFPDSTGSIIIFLGNISKISLKFWTSCLSTTNHLVKNLIFTFYAVFCISQQISSRHWQFRIWDYMKLFTIWAKLKRRNCNELLTFQIWWSARTFTHVMY